jgi:hypothetical protein
MERPPLPIAMWVLALATVVLARPHARVTAAEPVITCVLPAVSRVDPIVAADQLYRAGKFAEAAEVARSYAPQRDGVDGDTLATQYAQLARAWAIGMDPTARPSDALIALREAYKLDLVLGGVFGTQIIAREKLVAPRAVAESIANGDREGAEAAQHVVDTLGR